MTTTEVEWRRGIPSRKLAEAQVQFQTGPGSGPVCVFQARCAGPEGGLCTTVFGAWNPGLKRWQWCIASPVLCGPRPDGTYGGGSKEVAPHAWWEWRPVHLWEGTPIPWREPGPNTAVDWSDYEGDEWGNAAPMAKGAST